jgi:4-amino-4-deoxy-L-arabinose transferase-like glycosyltransferase
VVASPLVKGSSRRFYLLLGLVTLGAFAVRLAYALIVKWDQPVWGDAFTYHHVANGIVDGYGFQTWLPKSLDSAATALVENPPAAWSKIAIPVGASADNPPLYPLYLAGFSLVGLRSFHAHMIASIFLGTGAVFMIGLVGRKVAGARAGIIAALLGAVYANLWLYDALVLSESMAILAAAVTLLLAYRAWEQPTLARVCWVGVACGLTMLVRAEFFLLMPIVLIPLVIKRMDGKAIKVRIGYLAAAGAVALLVISPWLIRNLTAFEKPETLSTDSGLALAVGSCDITYHGDFLGWWSPKCVNDVVPKGDPSEADQFWRKRATNYISDHLDRYPVVLAARLGRIWEIYRPGTPWGEIKVGDKIAFDIVEGRSESAARIALAQFYLLVPFTVLGFVVLWRRKVTIVPLLALPIMVSITALITFGNTRYRSIAEVTIVVASAVAFDALLRRYWDRRRKKPGDEVPEAPTPDERPSEDLQPV